MEQYYLRNREKIRAQQKEYHKQQHAIELLRAKSERWRRAHGIMPRTKKETHTKKKEPKEKKLKYKRRDKKAEQEKLERERQAFIDSYDFVMVF
jgi:glycerophosphoryl diester phosphodiesterase